MGVSLCVFHQYKTYKNAHGHIYTHTHTHTLMHNVNYTTHTCVQSKSDRAVSIVSIVFYFLSSDAISSREKVL